MSMLKRFRRFNRATILGLTLFCWSISSSGLHSTAIAGGASGKPGIIKFLVGVVKDRHRKGVEYALDNAKVKSLISDLASDIALQMHLPDIPAATLALQIADNIEAALLASKEGFSKNLVHKLVEDNLGAFVAVECPPCDKPLAISKIAVAFATAYTYGFTVGQ